MCSFFLLILLFSSHPSLSFQSALPNPFSFFRLDALPPPLADVRFNETMGHSDAVLSIGLNNRDVEPEAEKEIAEESQIEPDARSYLIPIQELSQALEKALKISSQTHEEIKQSGWKVVHQSDIFSLYKRRLKRIGGGDGPVEYLMTGTLPDVSPRYRHSTFCLSVSVCLTATLILIPTLLLLLFLSLSQNIPHSLIPLIPLSQNIPALPDRQAVQKAVGQDHEGYERRQHRGHGDRGG